MKFITWFDQIGMQDVAHVGGKNASLGEMITQLSAQGISVPFGFAITADGYRHFMSANNLQHNVEQLLNQLHENKNVQEMAHAIRQLIVHSSLPADLSEEIAQAYTLLCRRYKKKNIDVALRSSATAEDLPGASFAGQLESYLHIHSIASLLEHCKKCYASLFTDRVLAYRKDKKFLHTDIALSLGVQKMVRSDKGVSGVAFTLDTESGFKDAIIINASYGLGEAIVQGAVNPDEFWVHKPTLEKGFRSIIRKKCADKAIKIVYASKTDGVKKVKVAKKNARQFCLSDDDILELSRAALIIEKHYSAKKGSWCPMDIEWAKDGIDGRLYIVQARPETVFSNSQSSTYIRYQLEEKAEPILAGNSIGKKIVSGFARVVPSLKEIDQVKQGDIIVTTMTDPDWVPAIKRAAGIITAQGGRTCHAAIVSRELGVPALVGVADALEKIHTGMQLTLDCSQGSLGYVYAGNKKFKKIEVSLEDIPAVPTEILVNIADPDGAFSNSFLPVAGVGLARMEFIIANTIGIHPLAVLNLEKLDTKTRKKIETLSAAYPNPAEFFVDSLAQGIATIAAAFYPRKVIVRFSDFKTNEYRSLIGGALFEPVEENPMLGWRGASRYSDEKYTQAFALECDAIKKVRNQMGLSNVSIMVPFVRTIAQARAVIAQLKIHELHGLNCAPQLIMMVEIPSNVILIDDFSALFDGFSIGSNDLTQLTLGVDRDSPDNAQLFDERDPAVEKMMKMAIEGAHRHARFIGICGQAPSDYPEIADMLIKAHIDSISLNVDSVIPFLLHYKKQK